MGDNMSESMGDYISESLGDFIGIGIRSVPTAETIDALASIADDDYAVELGRLAERQPDLRDAVRDALDGLDHPRAVTVLRRLERGRADSQS